MLFFLEDCTVKGCVVIDDYFHGVFVDGLRERGIQSADWAFWEKVPSARVADAVYLSLNIDPRGMRDIEREAIAMPSLMPKEVKDRLKLAIYNLESNGGKLTIFAKRQGETIVLLGEFGYWARHKMGWHLPEAFPEKKRVMQQEPLETVERQESELRNGDFDTDSEFYPKELDIANQAWRAVALHGQGGEGTPKQRLQRWLEQSGYGLTDAEKNRIVAVCNWDKSAGRPKAG